MKEILEYFTGRNVDNDDKMGNKCISHKKCFQKEIRFWHLGHFLFMMLPDDMKIFISFFQIWVEIKKSREKIYCIHLGYINLFHSCHAL